ncbi:hypothetical protein ACWCO0_02555 [Streptomyces tubercidicus]
MAPLEAFAKRVHDYRDRPRDLLDESRKAGKVTLRCGASTKGYVILQFCGLTEDDLPRIGEPNADKSGCFTPGTGIPIVSEEEAKSRRPDQLLVLPWIYGKASSSGGAPSWAAAASRSSRCPGSPSSDRAASVRQGPSGTRESSTWVRPIPRQPQPGAARPSGRHTRTVCGAATSCACLRKARTCFRTWWEREKVSDIRCTEPIRPQRPGTRPAALPAHDTAGR